MNSKIPRRCALLAATALSLTLFTACFFSRTPPTNYDLNMPDAIPVDYQLKINSFSTAGIGHYKMVLREGKNRLKLDEYNRWSQQPGAMITKYLTAAFTQPDSRIGTRQRVYYLSGSVIACELDKTHDVVYLLIRYSIDCEGVDTVPELGTVSYRIKVKEATPDAFATALSKAANEFALHIKKEIDESIVAQEKAKKEH